MGHASEARIRSEYEAGEQTYDALVLSGGGAFGAFGAGFLRGWGEVEVPEFERPQFDQVSGISTGALIAPFAFVGTPEAYDQIVELYENPGSGWVRRRGIIPYLPGNVSLYDVSKLHGTIRSVISPELITAIGAESRNDRQLLVGATNVDYGLLRVWDLARVAFDEEPDEARDKIVNVLQASAAIPGAFPPIVIDDFLYVDGGASMQVVGGIEDRDWLTTGASSFEIAGQAPIRLRVWIIVNQKLASDPDLVNSRWTSIAARSLSTLLRTSTLQSLRDAESYLGRVDAHPDFAAEFHFVAIPQEFTIPDSDKMFDAETMRTLVDLGYRMGKDPESWRTKTLRPGAPFLPAD